MIRDPKTDLDITNRSWPNGELQFLASDNALWEYHDLYHYTELIENLLNPYTFSDRKPAALLMESSDELVMAIASLWLLKIQFFPLSPAMTDSELTRAYGRLDISVLITDRKNRKRAGSIPSHPAPALKKRKAKRSSKITEGSWAGDEDRVFGFFQTSGTTGEPAIVPLIRRQMLAATEGSARNFRPLPNRYWLHCLPFNHIGGIAVILRSLLHHSAIYRMDRFEPDWASRFLSENPLFQTASLVPTMLKRLLEIPGFQVHKKFEALLVGGGPISQSLIGEALERGIPLVTSYGMTETCAQISANPMLQPSGVYHPRRSVGTIFSPNRVQIRDRNGRSLKANMAGTIWLKGPQLFGGYLEAEKNRGKFDKDGWFNTGDLGYLNTFGQLFIQNRRNDIIITGGENVDPSEIEHLLENMEGVVEAAVVGVEDEEWGQKVVAFLVGNGTNPGSKELRSMLGRSLSHFKIPKEWVWLPKLPRTRTGKVKRNRLRELYLESGTGKSD
ncbi:MAG: AMP-binding protein [Balneolaceae bacterium]